jgi:hypothetical protein
MRGGFGCLVCLLVASKSHILELMELLPHVFVDQLVEAIRLLVRPEDLSGANLRVQGL